MISFKNMMHFDYLIVGAGLAGSTLANLLKKKWSKCCRNR
jgi:flavin-dependent dehydrogenase